ncbi:MAG: helix-turn-helix domain-containing protein [Verrucomicrobiia bacterium]
MPGSPNMSRVPKGERLLNLPLRNFGPDPDPGILREWLESTLDRMTVERVSAIHFACSPEWRMEPRRIGDDMFFYVTGGSGWAVVEGRRHRLAVGVCTHFRRGALHSAGHDPRRPLRVVALHYTARLFDSLTVPQALGFLDVFPLGSDRVVGALFLEACREYALKPTGFARGLEALVTRILLHLVRQHGAAMTVPGHRPGIGDLGRLLPSLDAMRKRHAEPIPIVTYARLAGWSEPQFRRVFHRAMGISPVQHLVRLRMERACWILRHTSQTVEAISSAVGYAEVAFFARIFRREMKVTPGAYRRLRGP